MDRAKALEKAIKLDKKIVTLEWPTGFGKTYASLKKAEHICNIMGGDDDDASILVLCDQITHIANWKEEVIKHQLEHLNIVYECYASIQKHVNKKYTIVIADEAHHISDHRFNSFVHIQFERALLLSATLTTDVVDRFKIQYKTEFKQFKIQTNTAISHGVLAEPQIYIQQIELDTYKPDYMFVMKKGKQTSNTPTVVSDYASRFSVMNGYKSVVVQVACTARQYYSLVSDQIEYYRKLSFKLGNAEWAMNKSLQIASERKRWLAEYKSNAAIQLLTNETKLLKTVTFCGSIDQADTIKQILYKKLPSKKAVTIHSQTKDYTKELSKFNVSGKEGLLLAVGMFRENANLPGIEAGICIQLDNNTLSFIQMLGRAMRSDNPKFYVLVIKNTQDEKYLTNVLEVIDSKYITYL